MPSDEDLTASLQELMDKAREFGKAAERKFEQVMDMIEDFFGKDDDDGS